jgi:chlorite dismutase
LEGKKVENPPEALLIYELCKTFSCLPSQLDEEDSKTIDELIVVMNAVEEHEKKESKAQKRKSLAQQKKGGAKRG